MKNAVILLAVMVVIVVSGCVTDTDQDLVLENEGRIEQQACSARNLEYKIIILESKYCGACRIAVPRLEEIEQELNTSFIFLDLSEEENVERMKEFRIVPHYTPTVLIGCDVYIGAKDKEVYKQAIEEFLG